jgi:hypothetical protein
MSRTDLMATSRSTGERLVHQGFCRGAALEIFCEDSPDPDLQYFAHRVAMGYRLDGTELPECIRWIGEVADKLEAIPPASRPLVYPAYDEAFYLDFLRDLRHSQDLLRTLDPTRDVTVLIA